MEVFFQRERGQDRDQERRADGAALIIPVYMVLNRAAMILQNIAANRCKNRNLPRFPNSTFASFRTSLYMER